MELVTLAHVTLNRIGSTSSTWMAASKQTSVIKEVPDGRHETLRELVIMLAEENGEPRGSLQNMWQERHFDYTQQRDAVVFNIQGHNVHYSTPYAVCYAHPALKIGSRYFKLEEVTL
jgi:hypothetical protein